MSQIFDALLKTDLVNMQDLIEHDPKFVPERAAINGDPSAARVQASGAVVTTAAVEPPPIRFVDFQLSALSPVFPFDDTHAAAAEQYRTIRTKILHHPKEPRVLAVTSGGPGDGKTVTAINLAASLALKKGMSVVIVDADLRRPRVSFELGIEEPGLSDVLAGKMSLDEALCRTKQIPNLAVLTAGTGGANPVELLDSDNWRRLMQELRRRFTCVVLDTTPVAAVADYDLVQLQCDGVVVVVRPDHSKRANSLKALQIVPKDKLIGVVLNCVEDWLLWKNHGYGYDYYRGKY